VAALPHTYHLRDERGFTLFELLTAMLLLLVGVLGSVALIDGANATTKTTKSREGGTNLVREVVESARSVDYDKVTGAALPGELMAKPGLADAEGASGWQVRRRNVLYTVTVDPCLFDDAKDGGGPHTGGTYCANSTPAGTSDANADDYRRVVVATEWGPTSARRRVEQTAILTNPSGGLGPRIICVKTANCANPSSIITQFSTTTVNFEVQSASADAVRWSVDDNGQNGDASGGPTAWTFGWPIGSHGTYQCGVSPSWSVDGDYLVNAQAFDARGIPGDLRTEPVSLDRAAPAAPCGLTGGRNGSVVDLSWLKNPERDIAGYRVFRVAIGSETSDPQVCALTSSLSCYDTNPPSAGDADPVFYYVRAYDATRNTASATLSVSQASNSAPDPPPTLNVSVVDGQAVLSWDAASDSDGSIIFYRIYRDGTGLADRHDATGDATQLGFTDAKASSLEHQYWVTAVDDQFQESAPVGPVTP